MFQVTGVNGDGPARLGRPVKDEDSHQQNPMGDVSDLDSQTHLLVFTDQRNQSDVTTHSQSVKLINGLYQTWEFDY